ncbi:hypothetical protein [Nocardioides gilvus]|uniref:hypothetical protein n=1 Tax=Nocardioides gilvus TaxID=1735589 RepID=UPI000D74C5F8|nr:hypothetical protein [Nocardioides gilvus]
MSSLRGLLSSTLLLLGLVLVAVAVPAVWADRYVLETDRYTEAVAPLIDEQVVQDQVVAAILEPVTTRLELPALGERLLVTATSEVVATDGFARVWTDAVRLSHLQAVEGIRGEGTGVNLVEDGIVVDRAALVDALRPRLAEAGLPLAAQIPDGEGTVVLAQGPEVTQAVTVARAADVWATPLAALAGGVLLAGIAISRHRPRAAVLLGLGLLAVAGALWVVLGLGSETTGVLAEVDDRRQSAVLVWEALSAPLAPMVGGVAVAGGVLVALGLVSWVVRR